MRSLDAWREASRVQGKCLQWWKQHPATVRMIHFLLRDLVETFSSLRHALGMERGPTCSFSLSSSRSAKNHCFDFSSAVYSVAFSCCLGKRIFFYAFVSAAINNRVGEVFPHAVDVFPFVSPYGRIATRYAHRHKLSLDFSSFVSNSVYYSPFGRRR